MKAIAIGLGFLAFVALTDAAAQSVAITDVGAAVADTTAMPKGLELLRTGALVRASFSPCGDPDRGTTQLTGTFLELQPGAFEMSTIEPGDRTLTHQVAIDDLMKLEVGTVHRATKRGGMIGGIGGALLGMAGAAIGSNEESGDASYGAGAAIGGAVGMALGLWLGHGSQETEWEEVPLYGAAFCDAPVMHD